MFRMMDFEFASFDYAGSEMMMNDMMVMILLKLTLNGCFDMFD